MTRWFYAILGTLVTLESERTLSIQVNRKAKHTDQDLQWDRSQHIGTMYSFINMLYHGTKTVSIISELLRTENEHLREVLTKCNYPS